jgi:DTW domain-containing protein YfiP
MTSSILRSHTREFDVCDEGIISVEEWRKWGPVSPFPSAVKQIVDDLKVLECKLDSPIDFGGNGGKLQGPFGAYEDKKHRATYEALDDPEKKFRFFSARQVACRLLGSRGYLCQKCWLAMEDCMCSYVKPCGLWKRIRFWLYMHPRVSIVPTSFSYSNRQFLCIDMLFSCWQDFLRQNNTGKLLWQIFGVQSATLCVFGIAEDEEIMWNEFKRAGKSQVRCLYPNHNSEVTFSVKDAFGSSASENHVSSTTDEDKTLHFILLDGTWNNSAAMLKRLKDHAKSVWGDEDLPCISLATGASAMHKLRPQPSWDRTCTAAAAIGLLSELSLLPQLSSYELDKQADAVEEALVILLDSLTGRRLRMGRSITRKGRNTISMC